MKHEIWLSEAVARGMPPTRGHDLKLPMLRPASSARPMPPTRGHDLKLGQGCDVAGVAERCPPHGGTT